MGLEKRFLRSRSVVEGADSSQAPLRFVAEWRPTRVLRCKLSWPASDLDRGEPTPVLHGARSVAERRCLGCGGLFSRENELLLNHNSSQMALADGFVAPRKLKIGTLPGAGRGEDAPIFEQRSRRDGWELVQQGTWRQQQETARLWFKCDPPEIWRKPHPLRSVRSRRPRQTDGINEKDGPWYMTKPSTRRRGQGGRVGISGVRIGLTGLPTATYSWRREVRSFVLP